MGNEAPKSGVKRRLRKILYVYMAVILALIFCSKSIYTYSLPKVSVVMPRTGRLNKEIEARGVIKFAKTIDICADNSGRIDELLISEGDVVAAGTVIARLAAPKPDDDAILRINNRLAGLELSKSDIKSRLAALKADPSELFSYEAAVADAQTALGRAQGEYNDASSAYANGDGVSADYAQAVADAERELVGRNTELQSATDELARIESGGGETFDDYEYLLAVETAKINLERRQDDYDKALDAVKDAKNPSAAFDDYEYQKSVNLATSDFGRSEQIYEDADENYIRAENHYYGVLSQSGDEEEIAAALQEMKAAESARQNAKWDADAAAEAMRAAMEDLVRAKDIFLSDSASAKEQAVKKAEDAADQAASAVADAKRELDEAKEALRRAELAHGSLQEENKESERVAAEQKLSAAQTAVDDAQYAYDNAVSGLSRAAQESAKVELHDFEAAGMRLTDANTALSRANRNLEVAAAKQLENIEERKKDYNLQLERLELDIELAKIDMLEARPSTESSGKLTSLYGGAIISVDKKIGQYAATGDRVAVAGTFDGGFVCEVTVPEKDARFIEVGDTAAVRRSGSGDAADASVTAVTLEGDMLRLKLTLESEEMNGGEYVSVKFAKQSAEFETIVPTEAVVSDPSSSYVWALASKEGALGMEYYTRKVRVFIADKDGFYTAISTGLENYQPVVLSYDKEPTVNGRVSRME